MKSRIGIIDDHPAVMLGVASILGAQPDLQVAVTAASAAELRDSGVPLDGILLDLLLADGSSPADNLRTLAPLDTPVLVYTSGDRPALIREAVRAGAAGMVRKSEPPETIVAAVRALLAGEVVASADWAAAIDVDPEFTRVHLSGREAEVLAHYASGETAERVASMLFISRETVLDHIRRIRQKYAAADRPARTKIDLYRRAVEDGHVGEERTP